MELARGLYEVGAITAERFREYEAEAASLTRTMEPSGMSETAAPPPAPATDHPVRLVTRRFLAIMRQALVHAPQDDVVRAATAPTDSAFLRVLLDLVEQHMPSEEGDDLEYVAPSPAEDVAARAARLKRVVNRASEALGDPERADAWLVSPNRALGAAPVALLGSDQGEIHVLSVLTRIEHGVFG